MDFPHPTQLRWLGVLTVVLWGPFVLSGVFGMSEEVFNHSLKCEDLPDDNSTLKDLRPCLQVPIKAILNDGRCDYTEIDEGR